MNEMRKGNVTIEVVGSTVMLRCTCGSWTQLSIIVGGEVERTLADQAEAFELEHRNCNHN